MVTEAVETALEPETFNPYNETIIKSDAFKYRADAKLGQKLESRL